MFARFSEAFGGYKTTDVRDVRNNLVVDAGCVRGKEKIEWGVS